MAQLTDDCFAFGGPLLTVEDAAGLMTTRISPVKACETVALADAEGRVLAADIMAPVPLPPFANSAVDGYAVRHLDLKPGSETVLSIGGRLAAGASAQNVSMTGRAVRIFTGAPMPAGADTVFMQEDVALGNEQVRLPPGLKRGANMRPAGEDIAQGHRALAAGTQMQARHLALAAALGFTHLEVRRRLRVGVFSTGNELSEGGVPLREAAIYDSNRIMLLALVKRCGAVAVDLGISRDHKAELAVSLKVAAFDCDLILTSGGVSTGEEDHVKAAVESVGSLAFWRIAIKPGRPVAMGVIGGAAFVGLPGNPVAVYVTFAFIVRPLLSRLAGALWREPRRIQVTSGFAYRKKTGRREYVRVSLSPSDDGGFEAHKHPREGAGMITSLTETDGLLELPDDMTALEAGQMVPFIAYGDLA
jgi:molybdopterin molybdotransferase